MAAIVTTESTIIINDPAMPWSARAEMPKRATGWTYLS